MVAMHMPTRAATSKRRLLATAALAISLAPGWAAAQGARPADAVSLEEVVVTAQKREESLQDAPISIVAMTEEVLEQKGITSLNDLRSQVPNLQMTPHPNSAGTTLMFIRGVGITDDQITQDPSVAIYMDGVYLARSQGLAMDVADIARIEVLRGPQGTLYGRNATGGAVNFITRTPEVGAWGLKQELTVGNRERFLSKTAVNVPLGETAAARLSYMRETREGFVRNLGTYVPRFGDKDREAWRADLLWRPSEAISLRYAYDNSSIGDTPAFIAPVPNYPLTAPRPTAGSPLVAELRANDITSSGHSLTAEWELSPTLTVKSITAYRELDNFQNENYFAGVATAPQRFRNNSQTEQSQWSEELQLLGSALDGRLTYITGLYYFTEDGGVQADNLSTRTSGGGSTVVLAKTRAGIDNGAYALFGQATWTPLVSDGRLHLTGGIRWSRDERRAFLQTTSQTLTPALPLVVNPLVRGESDFENISPTAVIAYDATDSVNVYAKVARGYKTGGFNTRASSAARFSAGFEPETLTSYEAGVKSQFWDNRIRLNTAVFLTKYKDIQINIQSDPSNPRTTDVLNAGKATIKGLEADLTVTPARGLVLTLNYGYLDAKYDEILTPAGANVARNFRFSNSPKHSYSADITYETPPLPFGVLTTNLNYTRQDDFFSSSTGTLIIGDYGLLNGRVTLSDIPALKGLRVAVWGRNLGDEEYYVAHFNVGATAAVFGEPKSYGVSFYYEY